MMPFLRCLAQEDRKGHSKFYPIELLELIFEAVPPTPPPVNILRKNQNDLELKNKESEKPSGITNEEQVETLKDDLKIKRKKRWGTVNSYESSSDSDGEKCKSCDEEYDSPVPSARDIYIGELGEKCILQVIKPQPQEEEFSQLSTDLKNWIEIHE
jgi:hypothetical protein